MSRDTRRPAVQPPEREKVDPTAIDVTKEVALAVLSVRASNARSILPGTQKELTLRSGDLWDVVPGEVVEVRPRKVWSYFRHTYISGSVERHEIDLGAFGITPLALMDLGMWDPKDHYWGEEGEPLEDWAVPIHDRGPRREFEMEQIIPGEDSRNPDSGSVRNSVAQGG